MKKIAIFILFSMLISTISFAHPPKNVVLNFNKETGQMDINIEHSVSNTKVHFIKEIVIKAGDKGYFIEEFPQQSSKKSETLTVSLPVLKKGEDIEVTAKCSVYGKKKALLVVE